MTPPSTARRPEGPRLDPAERVVASPSGQGYWVEDQNGTAYPFGDATGLRRPKR